MPFEFNIYPQDFPFKAGYTFFISTHEIVFMIVHMIGHKTSLNTLKKKLYHAFFFSDHKLEVNFMKKYGKVQIHRE